MKLFIYISLVVLVAAAPQKSNPEDVEILKYESDNIGLGSYSYNFEQSDGTKREEQGELINTGSENESIVVRGSYSWMGPDNVYHVVTYVADENGYQPSVDQRPGGSPPIAVIEALLGKKIKK